MTYFTSCRTNTGKECLNYKCAHLARDGVSRTQYLKRQYSRKAGLVAMNGSILRRGKQECKGQS